MTFFATFLLLFAFQQGTPAGQTQPPTAESIIEKYIAAKGGEAALRKIKNYKITGNVLSKNKTIVSFETYQAAGRHLTIDRFPDGRTRKQGTDGQLAWRIDINGSPALLRDQEAQDYIRHNQALHNSLEWSQQFSSILYAGQKTTQHTNCHHLIFVADNRHLNRYFSIESGLLIREEHVIENTSTVDSDEKTSEILISEIGNYEPDKQNGIPVPRKRLNRFGSGRSIEFRINSVESNATFDDNIFATPDSILKLKAEQEAGAGSVLMAETPESAVRSFLKAMAMKDLESIKKHCVANPDLSILAEGDALTRPQLKMMMAMAEEAPLQYLEIGSSFRLPTGKKVAVDATMVNDDRKLLTMPGNPIPFPV